MMESDCEVLEDERGERRMMQNDDDARDMMALRTVGSTVGRMVEITMETTVARTVGKEEEWRISCLDFL